MTLSCLVIVSVLLSTLYECDGRYTTFPTTRYRERAFLNSTKTTATLSPATYSRSASFARSSQSSDKKTGSDRLTLENIYSGLYTTQLPLIKEFSSSTTRHKTPSSHTKEPANTHLSIIPSLSYSWMPSPTLWISTGWEVYPSIFSTSEPSMHSSFHINTGPSLSSHRDMQMLFEPTAATSLTNVEGIASTFTPSFAVSLELDLWSRTSAKRVLSPDVSLSSRSSPSKFIITTPNTLAALPSISTSRSSAEPLAAVKNIAASLKSSLRMISYDMPTVVESSDPVTLMTSAIFPLILSHHPITTTRATVAGTRPPQPLDNPSTDNKTLVSSASRTSNIGINPNDAISVADSPGEQTPREKGRTAGIILGAISFSGAFGVFAMLVARLLQRRRLRRKTKRMELNSWFSREKYTPSPSSLRTGRRNCVDNDIAQHIYKGKSSGAIHASSHPRVASSRRDQFISGPIESKSSLGWI